MSRASVRAYFMLMGGVVVVPIFEPPAAAQFDIRDYWLGIEPSGVLQNEEIEQWLKG